MIGYIILGLLGYGVLSRACEGDGPSDEGHDYGDRMDCDNGEEQGYAPPPSGGGYRPTPYSPATRPAPPRHDSYEARTVVRDRNGQMLYSLPPASQGGVVIDRYGNPCGTRPAGGHGVIFDHFGNPIGTT